MFSQGAAAQAGYVLQTIGNPAQSNVDFGTRIAVVGDVDGDARDDYVVGDPQALSGQLTTSRARFASCRVRAA